MKSTGQMSRLKNDPYCKTLSVFQAINKLLLKKGLHTIVEVVEDEKTQEENTRLLIESLTKLLKHTGLKKKVKAILRPFKREGFEAMKERRILSIKKDGLEELDYTIELAQKRKAFRNMLGFDSLGYRKRQMHD